MVEASTFRRVLGYYPTGVCAVTAIDSTGQPWGMVVGSFTSVSLDPPLVGFFPDKKSSSWPEIERSGKFCINVLASDQMDLCQRLSARGVSKFAGIDFTLSGNGSPVLPGILAWIDCALHAVHEAGDHYGVYGRVLELEACREARPLLFHCGQYGEFALPDVAASA